MKLKENDPRIKFLAEEIKFLRGLLTDIEERTKDDYIHDTTGEIDTHLHDLIDYMLMGSNDERLREGEGK